jgi:hypothetical protein
VLSWSEVLVAAIAGLAGGGGVVAYHRARTERLLALEEARLKQMAQELSLEGGKETPMSL